MELFSSSRNEKSPLAYRMRPRDIEEFIGQDHIAGPGRLLRRIIQADRLSSLIFYGPPGTGKTTLARVIANTTSSHFITMNAVLSGVKDLREAIAEAGDYMDLYGRRTILFVDEVHRWNKSQQDALLPSVENGTVILIGATTENPYFEVNKALVSRSRIFQLKPLTQKNLKDIALQAISDPVRGYGNFRVSFEEGALEHLVKTANGDARSLLNAVELAVETSVQPFPPETGTVINVSFGTAEESIQKKAVLYDKEGDCHFDTISAFIKSVRGSDPDATLYWLARMVRAGEDPRFIFRRMLISASEDIGMADPSALGIVESAASAFDRVGLPEGRFHLTQAALYLANAPKSNSTMGFFDALEAVEKEYAREVPGHLQDANRDKHSLGHGEGYLYPHAFRDHWVAQQYLPSGLQGRIFYEPSDQGFEASIRDTVQRRRELQIAAGASAERDEVLTFSPPDRESERWLNRIAGNAAGTLARIRDGLFSETAIRRHDCILVMEPSVPVLLWEAVRRTPEGSVWFLPQSTKASGIAEHWAAALPEDRRPFILPVIENKSFNADSLKAVLKENLPENLSFDIIIMRDMLTRTPEREMIISALTAVLSCTGKISMYQVIPRLSQRISDLEPMAPLSAEAPQLAEALHAAEESVFGDASNELVNWDIKDLVRSAELAGLDTVYTPEIFIDNRLVRTGDLDIWLDPLRDGYGRRLSGLLDGTGMESLRGFIYSSLSGTTVEWKQTYMHIECRARQA